MKIPSMLVMACAAASVPMLAGSAAAAPVAPNLALSNADTGVVQEVQYRRSGYWRGGRWIGPAAAGFAAGVVARGAYDAYAAAPGYAYAPQAYGTTQNYPTQFPAARCGDEDAASAYPAWACPANPSANGW
jgi:hypothetical protein